MGLFSEVLDIGKSVVLPNYFGAKENSKSQADANQTNLSSAREANAWSERMSNTAYQRAMSDMKDAGLNPMLAFSQGGSSTPSAQVAHVESTRRGDASIGIGKDLSQKVGNVQNVIAMRNQSMQTDSNVKLQSTQEVANTAQAKLAEQKALESQAETQRSISENKRSDERHQLQQEQRKLDLKYGDAQNVSDIFGKVTGSISDIASPFRGFLKRGNTDYPTGNSGKRMNRYKDELMQVDPSTGEIMNPGRFKSYRPNNPPPKGYKP